MDGSRFDNLVRRLGAARSRRQFVGTIAGVVGEGVARAWSPAALRTRHSLHALERAVWLVRIAIQVD